MKTIELNELLEYLATGENGNVVTDALKVQPNAQRLLSHARAAIELLSPGHLDEAVTRRLAAVAKLLRQPAPQPAPPPRSSAADFTVLRQEARPRSRSSARRRMIGFASPVRPPPPGPIEAATQAGARDVERSTPLMLEKPSIRPLDDGREAMHMTAERAPPARMAQASWSSLEIRPPDKFEHCRLRIRGGVTVDLWHELRDRADRLMVRFAGPAPAAAPVQVTWLPEAGEVIRAFTDQADTVALPWPSPGRGVLRIDAHRAIEIEFRVGV